MLRPGSWMRASGPLSACSSGAPGCIAASGSKTAGSTSYSTSKARQPASAAASLSASTPATRCPMKRTTSSSTRVSAGSSSGFSCRAVENVRSGAPDGVSTLWTPGIARAAAVSIETIRAWAWGERSSFRCNSPNGGGTSSVYRTAPVTTAGPAGVATLRPNGATESAVLDMLNAGDGVGDRAIAGATAEISFHRRAEVLKLFLVQRGRRQHHARRTEPALEALRRHEATLHRVLPIRSAQTLDRGDLASFGPERRSDAAMHRVAVQQHGAGAAIAGIAAFLDPEPAELSQERAKTLAWPRHTHLRHAIDGQGHDDNSRRISSASRNVM